MNRPLLKCKYDGKVIQFQTKSEFKKITVNGKKQRVHVKDYCSIFCSRPKINFCKAVLLLDDYNLQQYLLWKMIRRTPIQSLEPILESRMRVEIIA